MKKALSPVTFILFLFLQILLFTLTISLWVTHLYVIPSLTGIFFFTISRKWIFVKHCSQASVTSFLRLKPILFKFKLVVFRISRMYISLFAYKSIFCVIILFRRTSLDQFCSFEKNHKNTIVNHRYSEVKSYLFKVSEKATMIESILRVTTMT